MMYRHFFLFVLSVCFALSVWADKVVLQNGKTITGQVLIQNDEVVIIRDAAGMRFQFPASDVALVSKEEVTNLDTLVAEAPVVSSSKKAAILLEVAGGGASLPKENAGGNLCVDVLVGTFDLASRHIFVGGGLGYRGMFRDGQTYSFLPLEVAVRVPFLTNIHAPYVGASVGYGFSVNKAYKGGLSAGLDVGYRYQSSPQYAIGLAIFTSFQQSQMQVVERIQDADEVTSDFSHFAGRSWVMYGLKFAVYF